METVTLFNAYTVAASRSQAWQRTVIWNATWDDTKAANVRATGGYAAADQAAIIIPHVDNLPQYAGPKEWAALTDEERAQLFTLNTGDIIVRGLVEEEVGAEFTMADLQAKYDDVLTITSIDNYDRGSFGLRHWEVGAR